VVHVEVRSAEDSILSSLCFEKTELFV